MTLRVDSAPPDGTLVFAWSMGTPLAPVDVDSIDPFGVASSGCQLHLRPGTASWLGAIAMADTEEHALTVVLPDAPHLAGRDVATQAFWVRGGPFPELETTNGLRLTLGY